MNSENLSPLFPIAIVDINLTLIFSNSSGNNNFKISLSKKSSCLIIKIKLI